VKTYRCIKEFSWNGILFQVGVLRAWYLEEQTAFVNAVHGGDGFKFTEHWEIVT